MEATQTKHDSVVNYLLDLNDEHSEQFVNSQRSRQAYREKHPTEIAVLKCMDGRVHIPVYTNTPLGIIQPWRNIGGKFNLGWPHFKETIQEWSDYCIGRGRQSIVFTTYHFAKGLPNESEDVIKHRGCAGFGYDTAAAKEASLKLKQQFDSVFRNDSLYAIQCGVETDFHTLILHGENGEVLDLSEQTYTTTEEIIPVLKSMYPQIPDDALKDLVPLVKGNIEHVRDWKAQNPEMVGIEHKERVLAIGRGFDWLHEPNLALIIGPYDIKLAEPIAKAAGLLWGNISEGRISESDGLVLLVSAPYRKAGYQQRLAEQKAKLLAEFALEVIEEQAPQTKPLLSVVIATCNLEDRKLDVLDHIKSPRE